MSDEFAKAYVDLILQKISEQNQEKIDNLRTELLEEINTIHKDIGEIANAAHLVWDNDKNTWVQKDLY